MSNKLKLMVSIAVVALGVGIVVWRESQRPPAPTEPSRDLPQVVLFVDLSEEDEEQGCGALIRAVRAAAARGVRTEEVDPRDAGDRAARYRLLSAPTVLTLDLAGNEVRRFEGESPETVRGVQEHLAQLESR